MALKATLDTIYGETRELYVRINNVEASNHGVPAVALARGYLSQQAFDDGKGFVYETTVEFPADVSMPLWQQGYAALKALPEFAEAEDV